MFGTLYESLESLAWIRYNQRLPIAECSRDARSIREISGSAMTFLLDINQQFLENCLCYYKEQKHRASARREEQERRWEVLSERVKAKTTDDCRLTAACCCISLYHSDTKVRRSIYIRRERNSITRNIAYASGPCLVGDIKPVASGVCKPSPRLGAVFLSLSIFGVSRSRKFLAGVWGFSSESKVSITYFFLLCSSRAALSAL